jgi:oxaloacetate decarboxylase beta subunit
MLMLGNLLRESLLAGRLAETAGGALLNIITLVLTTATGSTMAAETFLTTKTLQIVGLGLVAFVSGTASGVVTAKIMNLFLKNKINPLIGSAGIASVPIAARVSQQVGAQANPRNYLREFLKIHFNREGCEERE